eukprot:TRINITY_DN1707_c0_g1_i3.p1 TRINITY_DN1707_c0_g1~~TRINITY_DN1707_c0_g1_i3.p1  ORF type:complete len:216 (+),score=13.76 TRINITY_DN1707_c0_g1_i3:52-648(+)
MSPHQVVFGEPYNSADQKNLKKHMEIMEHVRHDVKKRSIAVKVHQSIQYDKNKKESAFATRYLVLVSNFRKKRFGDSLWQGPCEVLRDNGREEFVIWDCGKQDTCRVNVQHLKGPFTVEELKTTFCHADPKQLVNRLAMTTKSTQRHTNQRQIGLNGCQRISPDKRRTKKTYTPSSLTQSSGSSASVVSGDQDSLPSD